MPTQCFLVEHTDEIEHRLRRMSDQTCPNADPNVWPRHHASALIGTVPYKVDERGVIPYAGGDVREDFDNPNWPTKCDHCEYVFTAADFKCTDYLVVYRNCSTGEIYRGKRLHNMPPGAMFEVSWLPFAKPEAECGPYDGFRVGDDGKCWSVILPDGGAEFCLDQRSTDGNFWTRTGTAPNFTLTPSIWRKGYYHGFLQNGILTDSLGK